MRYLPLCLLLALSGWGCGSKDSDVDLLETRLVTLPNGKQVRAEVMIRPVDMQRGMMFRDSMPEYTGMLFVHQKPDAYTYWMYNVRVPLDIIWMDTNRRVVEIAAQAQPCKTKASECPHYGGKYPSQYVLELPGGAAARNGINVGDTLTF